MKARFIFGYSPPTSYRFYRRGPNWLTIWLKPFALQVWWKVNGAYP